MAKKAITGRDDRADDRPRIAVPVIGTPAIPSADRLIFYGVLGILGILEIVEWPLVLIVGVGHYLTEQKFSPLLREAGQAAETA